MLEITQQAGTLRLPGEGFHDPKGQARTGGT
jgi:hypothetical protein